MFVVKLRQNGSKGLCVNVSGGAYWNKPPASCPGLGWGHVDQHYTDSNQNYQALTCWQILSQTSANIPGRPLYHVVCRLISLSHSASPSSAESHSSARCTSCRGFSAVSSSAYLQQLLASLPSPAYCCRALLFCNRILSTAPFALFSTLGFLGSSSSGSSLTSLHLHICCLLYASSSAHQYCFLFR